MVAHDPRVEQAFPDGRLWVTLGADTVGADLAAAIIAIGRLLDPGIPELSDPLAAGARLGRVLEGRRVLLVVDDVWTSGQVEPFSSAVTARCGCSRPASGTSCPPGRFTCRSTR
jgi:hypothetical protein